VQQIPILQPNRLIVLLSFIVVDEHKLVLEGQSIAHLVEEEGEEELTPVLVELSESLDFILSHRVAELVAVDNDVGDGVEQNARKVQVGEPPVSGRSILNHLPSVGHIILKVWDVVKQLYPGVEALVHVVVVVVELGSDLELKGVLERVSPRECNFVYVVPFPTIFFLADCGMCLLSEDCFQSLIRNGILGQVVV
jgi:hypothetical protein